MTATRRRGEELEQAIHTAVLAELTENGYSCLTFEAVAARAGTSKPVLYRRWPTKPEMTLAAIASKGPLSLTIPDTGTLEQDLKQILRAMREVVFTRGRATVLSLLAELEEPAELEAVRELLLAKAAQVTGPILERARERGELGPRPLPTRVASLPIDLARQEFILTGIPSDETLDEIVDQVVLPTLRACSRADTGA